MIQDKGWGQDNRRLWWHYWELRKCLITKKKKRLTNNSTHFWSNFLLPFSTTVWKQSWQMYYCGILLLVSTTGISLMVLLLLRVFLRYVFIHIISLKSEIVSLCQGPVFFSHLWKSLFFFPLCLWVSLHPIAPETLFWIASYYFLQCFSGR